MFGRVVVQVRVSNLSCAVPECHASISDHSCWVQYAVDELEVHVSGSSLLLAEAVESTVGHGTAGLSWDRGSTHLQERGQPFGNVHVLAVVKRWPGFSPQIGAANVAARLSGRLFGTGLLSLRSVSTEACNCIII